MNGLGQWHQWQCVLASYSYPVDLTRFAEQQAYEGWFKTNISKGDREQTIQFENSFREAAPNYLGAWFEVIFWKLYSNKKILGTAYNIINAIKQKGVSANDLWERCCRYINAPSTSNFKDFQQLVVASRNIAVCATFPAFISPERFPMIDTQVAKWVSSHYEEQNRGASNKVKLQPPKPGYAGEVLSMSHYPFLESWTSWCRVRAQQLSELSGFAWRPRDVEMTIFTAQRNNLNLPPIA